MSTIPNGSHRQIKINASLNRKQKAEWSAVSVVVELDNRRKEALGARDFDALKALADEYQAKGCRTIANQIRHRDLPSATDLQQS